MAYCVNCGVEIEKSIQYCPLCGVEIINPKEPYDHTLPKPYSAHVVRAQINTARRYTAWVFTVLLLLAGVVCVMADLVYNNALTWSVYVASSLMLVWVILLLPFIYTGLHPAAAILLDVSALLLFLYLINGADQSRDWYARLAMPQVLVFGVLGLMNVTAFKSRRIRGWQQYGIVSMSAGVSMMALEALLDLFNNMQVELTWSWFVIVPAFALGLIFFIIERKRVIKEEILKRLRI